MRLPAPPAAGHREQERNALASGIRGPEVGGGPLSAEAASAGAAPPPALPRRPLASWLRRGRGAPRPAAGTCSGWPTAGCRRRSAARQQSGASHLPRLRGTLGTPWPPGETWTPHVVLHHSIPGAQGTASLPRGCEAGPAPALTVLRALAPHRMGGHEEAQYSSRMGCLHPRRGWGVFPPFSNGLGRPPPPQLQGPHPAPGVPPKIPALPGTLLCPAQHTGRGPTARGHHVSASWVWGWLEESDLPSKRDGTPESPSSFPASVAVHRREKSLG